MLQSEQNSTQRKPYSVSQAWKCILTKNEANFLDSKHSGLAQTGNKDQNDEGGSGSTSTSPIRENKSLLQIFISLQFYIHVLHALPTLVKLPFPSSPTPTAFPYEPVWGQYQSVRQTLKIPKRSEASVLTSLQHIRSLLHYKLQFLVKCLFKCNFPGNVKDNINNDHELGWINRFAEVHCSLNI